MICEDCGAKTITLRSNYETIRHPPESGKYYRRRECENCGRFNTIETRINEMTKAQHTALVRVSIGKSIMREHARRLQDLGYVDIKRAVPHLTPKGKEYIEGLSND